MNIRNCTGTHGRKHLQRGFALVTGVFLITMLFLLSAYMIGFRVQQDASISLDTLGTRAYAAARSGAEWGAYNSLRPGPCALGNTTTSLALGGTLSGYTTTVKVTGTQYNEGVVGVMVTMCSIVSNACNQPSGGNCPNPAPGVNYVERQITVTVGQ